MKLFELLQEAKLDPKAWNEKFEKDCAFYFEQMGTKAKTLHMLRGTESERIKVGELNPFRPRVKPLDMPSSAHAQLNDFFEKQFGHPYRNGLFVSGDEMAAEMYGELYVIVPAGKFEWLTSNQFFDLYHSGIADKVDDEMDEVKVEAAAKKLITRVINSKKWVNNTDLPGCIKKGHEIMLWCPNGYYMFDREMFLPDALKK